MTRRFLALSLLSLCFVACNRNGNATVEPTGAALLTVEEVRDGCVASTLDLMQDVIDRLSPALNVRDTDGLLGVASESGCSVLLPGPGGFEHLLFCPALAVRDETVSLDARIVYLADGLPTRDYAAADHVLLSVDATGDFLRASCELVLSFDAERGLVIEGDVAGTYDGCDISGHLDNVFARTLADPLGGGYRALFTSGNVDLDVAIPGGASAAGTAALFGRNAFVALEMSGARTQLEIPLEWHR